ncbi:MAG: ChbG/HpnK family deacetylase [Bryobacteraceae bacterium]
MPEHQAEPVLKTLIVNADDFGFTRDVNEGIVEAHRRGILTSTTIMATGAAFDHAVELARSHPGLDIGVHLVLVGSGRALRGGAAFPETVTKLMAALALGRIDVEGELEAQIAKVMEAGLRPTHLDSHKHTHLLPRVLKAAARLGERYGIEWVRRTLPVEVRAPGIAGWSERLLARHRCRMADRFLGFRETGKFDAAMLSDVLRRVPEGTSEFMCHPGYCGEELRAARTRLKESRRRELDALVAPEVRETVERCGIRLSGYGAIGATVYDG